jgi:catechol 2,3-dioxygenase-like lactoylglutathione lyase family enzyme
MALQLYMVGLMTQNMEKSQEFYRRLGVAIPADSENETHVKVEMGEGFTFFLNSSGRFKPEKPAAGEPLENCRVLFEYYLKSQAAVEAKYAELVGYGYQSYRTPFIFNHEICFAFVNDPDGNTILLSGDVEKTPKAEAEEA